MSDLLRRDFTARSPNTKYVGDITCIPIGGGQFRCLATVLDLHSKRLAGWSIAGYMRTELVTDALRAAAAARGADGLHGAIFHSDNGAPERPHRGRISEAWALARGSRAIYRRASSSTRSSRPREPWDRAAMCQDLASKPAPRRARAASRPLSHARSPSL
ncbi:Integrase core domain-containing protein [Streptomyces sp. Ncost-T10-10d]|nr:Integrase core domain-containing protein [Streptomyces sp. Ncost-T10-10d]